MSEQDSYSDRIEKMNPQSGDLLVISASQVLGQDQKLAMRQHLEPLAERLGVTLLLLDGGLTAHLEASPSTLLEEQRKQTQLLEQIATQNLALLEALADDGGGDEDASPLTYMDGTRVT